MPSKFTKKIGDFFGEATLIKCRDSMFRNLKLLPHTASLYIATEESLVKLPVQRCAR
jgi:hypothetical protein